MTEGLTQACTHSHEVEPGFLKRVICILTVLTRGKKEENIFHMSFKLILFNPFHSDPELVLLFLFYICGSEAQKG